MGSVIPFHRKQDFYDPHGSGDAFCLQCGHKWEAQAPVGVVQLECPECHTMKGLFRLPYSPNEGEVIRVCNCGNELFYLTPEGHFCPNCGIWQEYE